MAMIDRPNLTQERLKELLSYDPATGGFVWKHSRRTDLIGTAAGAYTEATRSIQIGVDRRKYLAHRLAWLYMTGAWPANEIDHIDTDASNNRWANLREATREQNQANVGRTKANSSGFKGVCWSKRTKLWLAYIDHSGRRYLGYFKSPEQAHAAYCEAAYALKGEFARVA